MANGATFAAGAAVVYAVGYTSLADYYAPFGLAPSDAGVTQTTLVATAATVFGILAAFIGIIVLVAVLVRFGYHRAARVEKRLWPARWVVVPVLFLLSAVAVRLGNTVTVFAGFPVLLGAAAGVGLTDRTSPPRDSAGSSWLRRPVAVFVAVAVVAMPFLAVVDGAATRLGRKLRIDGDFRNETSWEGIVRRALGINAPLAGGPECARIVARDGDRTWLMEWTGDVFTVRPVKTDDVTIEFSPATRACWRHHGP